MKEDKEVGANLVPAESGEISGLMKLALEGNHPVEVLERLVALQERVTDRNARMAFIQALHAFQREVGPVPKTKAIEVDQSGTKVVRSRYSPLNVIADHIREPLARNGFSYWWDSSIAGDIVDIRCTLQHEDGHSQTSSFSFPVKDAAAPKMSGVQIAGSARTYGERYSLIEVCGLTTADPDTDGAGEVEYITEGEAADLDALIQEVGADKKKFLKVYGVAHLEALPKNLLHPAIRTLEERRGRGAK